MKTFLLSLLIPAIILLHLLVAPYTKVEESAAIQAAHDILVYGVPVPSFASLSRMRASYDHLTFRGAVPRSFVGPVLLAGIAQPALDLGAVEFRHAQALVRAVLGLANGAALVGFAAALARAYGDGVARWWVVLVLGQFHVLFYASRTLGNVFALVLTTLAFSQMLPSGGPDAAAAAAARATRQCQALALLTFAAVVFRAELGLLVGATGLYLLLARRATIAQLAWPVCVAAAVALVVSVPIDSYFWQQPVWPELWAFYFNAVLGRASDWGTEPWHYYFSSALPRLLLNPVAWGAMLPLGLARPGTRRGARDLIVPSLIFVALYSLQPHKETRFILYVAPPLTGAAALGANYVYTRRAKSAVFRAASGILVLSAVASAAAATGMLLLSSLNYPGGDALAALHHAVAAAAAAENRSAPVLVHADVLSCMTGVTLFGQNPAGLPVALGGLDYDLEAVAIDGPVVTFDKTEDEAILADPSFWDQFHYLLTERRPAEIPGWAHWDVVGVVQGYAGIQILRPGEEAEKGGGGERVLGRGALVAAVRQAVRPLLGGWWVGPRMAPMVRILRRREGIRIVDS